jgi:DnaJ family protein C protein 7
MGKKKGAAKQNIVNDTVPPTSSSSSEASTPVIVPSTPSATTNASTSGTNTPKENGVPAPEEPVQDKTERADKLKENGNAAFKGGNYREAIQLYTEAIGKFLI